MVACTKAAAASAQVEMVLDASEDPHRLAVAVLERAALERAALERARRAGRRGVERHQIQSER